MSFLSFSNALGNNQPTPTLIIKQICAPSTTTASSAASNVSYSDYMMFWTSLQRTPAQATKMVTETLNKIVELQRQALKRMGKSKSTSTMEEMKPLWTLCNICRFIDLYLTTDPNNTHVRKAQKQYEQHRTESSGELFTLLFGEMDQHLMRTLRSLFDEATDQLSVYVDELVLMNTSSWALGDTSFDRDLSFQVNCDFSLQALRLHSKLTQQQTGQEAFSVFACVVNKLNALSVKPITPSSLESLSALLFMLNQSLQAFAMVDVSMSMHCEHTVRKFVYWPVPYGNTAAKLVERIQLERQAPGSLLRNAVQREHPALTKFGSSIVDRFAGQAHEWQHAARQIVVLHNNSPRSNVLRKLIARPLNKGRAGTSEMQMLREDLLIQLFECELMGGENAEEWHAQVTKAVRSRSAPELAALFDQAVFKKQSLLSLAKSTLGLSRAFERSKQMDGFSSTSTASFAPANWPQQQIRIPNLSFDFLEIAPLMGDAMTRRTMTALTTDTADGLPSAAAAVPLGGGKKKSVTQSNRKPARMSITIPGLEMFATVNGVDAFQNEEQTCPQQYIAYSADFDELVREARQLLPPGGVKSLEWQPVLRRVILGGMDVLHRTVSTYCALLAIDPALAAQLQFEFFLVPTNTRNDLAAFLAQRDGWYRKQVFSPFCNFGLLAPAIRADKDDLLGVAGLAAIKSSFVGRNGGSAILKRASLALGGGPPSNFDSDFLIEQDAAGGGGDGSNNNSVLDQLEDGTFDRVATDAKKHKFDAVPGKLLRPVLESYVRNAAQKIMVQVFDCECWESIDSIESDRSPDVTIPFLTRVELGLHNAVQQMNKQLQDLHMHTTGEEFDGEQVGLAEMLTNKHFLKAVSGGANAELKVCTPELSVHMYTMGLDGVLDTRPPGVELADASYMSLVVSNVPRYTWPGRESSTVDVDPSETNATTANPLLPWVEVQCVAHRTSLADLVKRKEKKPRDVEAAQDSLKYDAKTHHAGFVDIRSTLSSRVPFFITVDGQGFGPYYRIRVRRSTALSTSGGQGTLDDDAPVVDFPIMSFLPVQ